jgi:hypothetical protein
MSGMRTLMISATAGLALGVGVAFAQGLEFMAAQDAIDEAISHLQKASEGRRFNIDPARDTRRTRAMAYLLLAKTELQPPGLVQPLD